MVRCGEQRCEPEGLCCQRSRADIPEDEEKSCQVSSKVNKAVFHGLAASNAVKIQACLCIKLPGQAPDVQHTLHDGALTCMAGF